MPDEEPSRDPDVRFLLANERTLLAWLRTGLALQAGGLVIFQLAVQLAAREVLGVVLLLTGLACHAVGWTRYRAADAAIRQNRLPTRGIAPDLIVLAAVLLSVALAMVMIAAAA